MIGGGKAQAATLMGDPSPKGVIYRAVRKAASNGAAAPSNSDLADLAGLHSVASPARTLSALARDGAIQLETGACERRITIIATGATTKVSESFRPISRADRARRGETIRKRAAKRRAERSAEIEQPKPTVVLAKPESHDRKLLDATREQAKRYTKSRELSATFRNPVPIDRPTPVLRHSPPPGADLRPIALTRDPCPRCATRGDLGCKHQQPFQPA